MAQGKNDKIHITDSVDLKKAPLPPKPATTPKNPK